MLPKIRPEGKTGTGYFFHFVAARGNDKDARKEVTCPRFSAY
jgi:hypothetical protein